MGIWMPHIQDYYRNTVLDPTILDVSTSMVFYTTKDPNYSSITMLNKMMVIVFSEARANEFKVLLQADEEKNNITTSKRKNESK